MPSRMERRGRNLCTEAQCRTSRNSRNPSIPTPKDECKCIADQATKTLDRIVREVHPHSIIGPSLTREVLLEETIDQLREMNKFGERD